MSNFLQTITIEPDIALNSEFITYKRERRLSRLINDYLRIALKIAKKEVSANTVVEVEAELVKVQEEQAKLATEVEKLEVKQKKIEEEEAEKNKPLSLKEQQEEQIKLNLERREAEANRKPTKNELKDTEARKKRIAEELGIEYK